MKRNPKGAVARSAVELKLSEFIHYNYAISLLKDIQLECPAALNVPGFDFFVCDKFCKFYERIEERKAASKFLKQPFLLMSLWVNMQRAYTRFFLI